MSEREPCFNELGQPIGAPVDERPEPVELSRGDVLEGRCCRLEPLDVEAHAAGLFEAYRLDRDGGMWTYMPYGPFGSPAEFRTALAASFTSADPFFYAIRDRTTDKLGGMASFMRIDRAMRTIEVGHISYSPLLQRTTAATEAMYVMMKHAFDLGYRRYEWKCDALNQPSRDAAHRLGFQYEGTFRQARITRGRNRDTAWFSVIDGEWPALRVAYERWLDPGNFDGQGGQVRRLGEFIGDGSTRP